MIKNISIIGSGGWGCALACLLADKGFGVTLWSRKKEESEEIARFRENKLCLPGISLPDTIRCTHEMSETADADLFVLAVPSHGVMSAAKALGKISRGGIIVNAAKGFEKTGLRRLSEVISEYCPLHQVAVLSGPSHAEEVAEKLPTTVVAAAADPEVCKVVQDVFMTNYFRVYTHNDIIGVELGGALKNIIALCVGITDGLDLGDNTKAALMTRGLAEISRLGAAMGASPHTFAGLSGVGDLFVTCISRHSRNRRAGILIGRGSSVQDALEEIKMVVEGVFCTEIAYELARSHSVRMPITEAAYEVLFQGRPPRSAVMELMARDKKDEIDLMKSFWI